MYMLKVAVCDDNTEFLRELCAKIDDLLVQPHILFAFSDSVSLLERMDAGKDENFDIVISDICMPVYSGIETAEALKQKHPCTQFIFITAYTDYIQDVFSVNPIYYILKPVNDGRLAEALEKAAAAVKLSRQKTLNITEKGKVVCIRIDEIKFIESDKRKLIIHEIYRNTEITAKLDDIQNELPSYFIRCHKSYSVNMNWIRSIVNNRIELMTGESLPVAKVRYPEIKQKILNYLSETV